MSSFIYGMTHFFLEEEHIILLEYVYQRQNKLGLWIDVIHHHVEDTLQETEQPRKFFNQVFIGQLYLKIVMNGSNIVTDVRELAILIEEMRCLCKELWWCRFFMCGE